MKKKTTKEQYVSPNEYTKDYYYSSCGGYKEFIDYKGTIVPKRFEIALSLAGLKPGDNILDVGCGRGELIYQSAKAGAIAYGFDYSEAALRISSENINNISPKLRGKILLNISDAKKIPLKSDSIDVVFMLDVVEHLYPQELIQAFSEIHRILKREGRLIIHTTPNLWYYKYGYPLFRLVQMGRGKRLPMNPRLRWSYSHVHVNEQTPLALRKELRQVGFNTRVWLAAIQDYDNFDGHKIMRIAMKFLAKTIPFRYIFCDDIFALAIKK